MKRYTLSQLYKAVPEDRRAKGIYLPPAGRSMGVRCAATKGTGKSRLFGRVIVWGDFLQGVPTVVIDPVGGLVNEFLDKVARCPKGVQEALWGRVRYIDMAGSAGERLYDTYVVPFPLYLREGDETHYQIAQRYIDVIARTDPSLASAPILGMNAFRRVAEDVGMLLSAAGWQITEAEGVLKTPDASQERLYRIAAGDEGLLHAARFVFAELPKLKPNDREMQTSAYLRKIAPFQRDPVMRAMFGASEQGIDWQDVVDGGRIVLLDFSRVEGKERIQFLMLWVYLSLMRYIKRRGTGKHHPPLSLVIDEITFLLGDPDARHELLADDLVELVDRISRSHNIWVSILHQEISQVSKRVAETLMRMGTQLFGSTADPEAALQVARRFYPYEPHWVKSEDAVYQQGIEIDSRATYYSIQEQQELNSREIMDQRAFCFLIGVSPRDGQLAHALRPFTISHMDAGIYSDPGMVAEAKRLLMRRDGVRIEEIVRDITGRTAPSPVVAPPADAVFHDAPPPAGTLRRRPLDPSRGSP